MGASRFLALACGAVFCLALLPPQASAQVRSGAFNVSCANGANYVLTPQAQTVTGDVVTGYLLISRRHVAKVRLIPMGEGYRYSGRGIWLDGIRSAALLYFGKSEPLPCAVHPV